MLQEDDERFYLGVDVSRDERWIIMTSESKQSAEVWVLASDEPTATPRSVPATADEHEYSVGPWGDRFVIVTNDEAEDFRVVTRPSTAPAGPVEWDRPRSPTCRGVGSPASRRSTATSSCTSGPTAQPQLRILFAVATSVSSRPAREPSDVELDANPEYNATTVRFRYQSLTTPSSVYEEDVTTGERTLLKQTPALGVDLSRYRSTRTWATSADGTAVPVDVVWRDGTPLDGTAPLVVYGYGSYEASMPPWFSPARSRCSTEGGSGRSPIPAAAASSAATGTSTASCSPSATRSTTSSPAPSTSSPSASARRTGWRSAAAPRVVCWSVRR